MKWPSKTLQILPYFWDTKTHVDFAVFHSCYYIFYPNKCPGICQLRPGHSLGKNKVAWKKNTWVFAGSTYTKNLSKFINISKFLVISIEDRVCNFFLSDFWGGWHDKCYRWNFVTWRTKFLLLVMKTECYSRVNDFLNYILMLLCCYHFIWEKENWSLEFDIWFDNLWRRTFTNV